MAKILLVEDDQFLSALLKTRLEKEKFEVIAAHDGPEALQALRSVKPDLILLDIILPGKSGFDILEEMRSDPQLQDKKDVPVIIISNLGQESDMERGKELGVVDYFVKARVSIDELVKKVNSFITTPAKN
ncbi:MAG: response regulator [Candidatus Harrisonbacteria bacterium CG10_big_fil_rev_8_21_14_0_10_40_38]|uniref:Response regulator n=1 Tax=Candidatus Harrisonbacteria bacterium CG10_big_fil_rev_8_21_14_0_10_40_38 TaxID=1974583 RepID=A0A2H0URQ5_9BACT|nr:MAG: response regulator [Candidatus Harrisonbacteria bacterium CG10_big_fil_rev_8_21_14_0_10_40_38]